MKKVACLIAFLLSIGIINAQISLATGTTGTTTGVPQSYNEARCIEIKVISSANINVTAMRLDGFYCYYANDTAYIDARIYNSTTQALIAWGNKSVINVFGTSVTVPITCQLVSGQNYRIGFYCGGPNEPTINSANAFLPQSFPYTESSNSLQIIQAYDVSTDIFPNNINYEVPFITLDTATTTGINKINLAAKSSVYPNPANQSATIQFENSEKENCTLMLYNIQGQIVQTITNITTDRVEINRKDLSNGIYYFQLRGNKQLTSVGKIIFE